jgi:hypothetical protein
MHGLTAIFLLIASLSGAADLPRMLAIQGKLVDPAGVPRDGSFSVTFSLYDDPAGAAGSVVPLYTEAQTLAVNNGAFSAILGAVTPLSPDLFSGASAYLGITVGGDAEMTPLQRLAMSPYAFSSVQLVQGSDIRVNAGAAYSTFTAAGNWRAPAGVGAATASLSGGLTASSGTFLAAGAGQFSVQASSGVSMLAGTLRLADGGLDAAGTGITAGTATFTATGGGLYGLVSSSGVQVLAGTVRARGRNGLQADFGVAAATWEVRGFVENEGASQPPLSPSGTGRLDFDSTANQYQASENGGAYARLLASSNSQNLWDTDSVSAVNGQGRNLPAALTELDAAVEGTRVTVNCDALGSRIALRYNIYSVSTRSLNLTLSVCDTSNTANVLATVTVAVSAAGNYIDETPYSLKPSWCAGSKEVAVYTSGGNGSFDYIFKRVALIWKP